MDPTLIGSEIRPGIDQLRDIRGIESVPWWPPAEGWWLLLAAIVLIALALYHWRTLLRLRIPIPGITLGTWRWDAAQALRVLRRRAERSEQDAKTTAGELSELLRRIAMARLGRDACAGLVGKDWLDWLTEHDPAGFAWSSRGALLIDMPYAPPGRAAGGELLALIDAAYAWVTVSDPKGGDGRGGMLGRLGRFAPASWSRGSAREGVGA